MRRVKRDRHLEIVPKLVIKRPVSASRQSVSNAGRAILASRPGIRPGSFGSPEEGPTANDYGENVMGLGMREWAAEKGAAILSTLATNIPSLHSSAAQTAQITQHL